MCCCCLQLLAEDCGRLVAEQARYTEIRSCITAARGELDELLRAAVTDVPGMPPAKLEVGREENGPTEAGQGEGEGKAGAAGQEGATLLPRISKGGGQDRSSVLARSPSPLALLTSMRRVTFDGEGGGPAAAVAAHANMLVKLVAVKPTRPSGSGGPPPRTGRTQLDAGLASGPLQRSTSADRAAHRVFAPSSLVSGGGGSPSGLSRRVALLPPVPTSQGVMLMPPTNNLASRLLPSHMGSEDTPMGHLGALSGAEDGRCAQLLMRA